MDEQFLLCHAKTARQIWMKTYTQFRTRISSQDFRTSSRYFYRIETYACLQFVIYTKRDLVSTRFNGTFRLFPTKTLNLQNDVTLPLLMQTCKKKRRNFRIIQLKVDLPDLKMSEEFLGTETQELDDLIYLVQCKRLREFIFICIRL